MRTCQFWVSVVTLLLGSLLSKTASAEVALSFDSGTTFQNTTFDGLVGWAFTTSVDVNVERLGFYDTPIDVDGLTGGSAGDGLYTSHRVAIFETSGGASTSNILAEATVDAGTAAPLLNNFRMADVLGGPVLLTAGSYEIYGQVNRDAGLSDGYVRTAGGGTVGLATASEVTYDGTRFSIGHTSFDPTAGTTGSEGSFEGYFGPTFEFSTVTAVPEPASASFMLVGGMLVALRRRRRRDA